MENLNGTSPEKRRVNSRYERLQAGLSLSWLKPRCQYPELLRGFKRRGLLASGICLFLLIFASYILFTANMKKGGVSSPHLLMQRATAQATALVPTPAVSPTPTPLFFDDFTKKNRKDWALSSKGDTSGYLRTMANSQLVLTDTNHQMLIESLPTTTTFSDFSLNITFTLLKGDSNDRVGIYARGDSNLDHDYRIDIFGNNTFSINKELLNADKTAAMEILTGPTPSELLLPTGQPNTLTLIMKGPVIVLEINGSIAASVVDTDYTHGQIALFVDNGATSNGVSASFDTISIDRAPDQLSGSPIDLTPTVTPSAPTLLP